MNITELDEFQGLTAEMVREWLLANQWEPCGSSAAHLYYQCGSGEISEALLHEDLGWVIDLLALSYERSVQSILREINPREREGVPSEAARIAHPGNWMVSGFLNPSGTKHFEVWSAQHLPLASSYPYNPDGKRIACWPLDQNGNKVRWPTDAEGNML